MASPVASPAGSLTAVTLYTERHGEIGGSDGGPVPCERDGEPSAEPGGVAHGRYTERHGEIGASEGGPASW